MLRYAFAALLVLAACGFMWLGTWQLERLSWKRQLIAQAEQKLSQPPIPAPGSPQWPTIGPQDAYTRVTASGLFIPKKTVFVRASTRLGRGYWVMSPLRRPGGDIILINRGFVTSPDRQATPPSATTVSGLLRLTEPGGSLLQSNRPNDDAWYSRDVSAISARMGLADAAPYFIDADETPDDAPTGGLTVIHFPNNHLQYALTWFALALLSAVGFGYVLRQSPQR